MREREREFSRRSRSGFATLASLLVSSCGGPPELTMSAPQPILEARPDAGASSAASTPQERRATHCGPDITTDLSAAMALGLSLAVIEPTNEPTPIRWMVPGVNGEAVGMRFDARVVRSITQSETQLPEAVEVHQWDAVEYAHVRDPMEPTDNGPGRAAPRRGARVLALLNPDGMGGRSGWRLVRSWHLRSDESIEGTALGLRADARAASVFEAYAARTAAIREAATAPVMGGVR